MSCTINLKQYLNNPINKICSNGYHKSSDNHCAHFVSHVLGFRFGMKCINMTGKGDQSSAATIRVHDVFSKCPQVGLWTAKPENNNFCLAFVTSLSSVNLQAKVMRNVPKKHIGIYLNGMIYHYSNGRNKVVSQTPEEFSKHYHGHDITVFYGTMPQ